MGNMKSILLDDNGDAVFKNGDFVWIEGDEELAQQVRITLKTIKEEWFLDSEEGLDRNPLVAKIFNENEARDRIIEAVGQVPNISTVEEITFNRIGRNLNVDLILRKENNETLEIKGVAM